MKNKIITELNNNTDVSDWIIQENEEIKTESYFVGIQQESFRTVESHYCRVTVFNRHNSSIGYTTFRIASPENTAIRSAIEEGVFIAKGISNPDFTLPVPAEYPEIPMVDPEIRENPKAIHETNHGTLDQIAGNLVSGLKLASAELHLGFTRTLICSSSGLDGEQEESTVIFDTVLVSDTKQGQSEQLVVVRRRKYTDIDITGEIEKNSQYALDKTIRNLAPSGKFPVVFHAAVAKLLLTPFVGHSSMDFRMKKISRFNHGEPVFSSVEKDQFTFIADAIIPMGISSTRFSGFGIPGQQTTIIRDGISVSNWGPHDIASWLNMNPTGSFGNMVVKAGSTVADDIVHDMTPGLEVVAFSDLIPNAVTGDFMAEIRFGYWIEEGNKIPVTGGVVAGNVFEIFQNATFSRETTVQGNYHGPELIKFDNLQITGK